MGGKNDIVLPDLSSKKYELWHLNILKQSETPKVDIYLRNTLHSTIFLMT